MMEAAKYFEEREMVRQLNPPKTHAEESPFARLLRHRPIAGRIIHLPVDFAMRLRACLLTIGFALFMYFV